MKELVAWYQKKISSYDKAEWETMVEQLLVRGAYRRRVVDPSAQLPRSYLIDVDLVRGSSFPKAKPTVGLWRVVWLAVVRLVFLPGMYRWWGRQTSPACVRLLLLLWSLQVANLALFLVAPVQAQLECDSVLVPLLLMVALSVVHAHIVSTTALDLGGAGNNKLPGYHRRGRREVSGGGPGVDSNVTPRSAAHASKPAKFRRRAAGARRAEDKPDGDVRNRKRTERATTPKPELSKPTQKAKDSDDDNYMDWKRPNSPVAASTPPGPGNDSPLGLSPNIITRRRLDNFNGTSRDRVRISFGDGDDGFESLNGNFSNGSDNESRARRVFENFNLNNFNTRPAVVVDCGVRNPDEVNEDLVNYKRKKFIDQVIKNPVLNDNKADISPINADNSRAALNMPTRSDQDASQEEHKQKRTSVRFTSSWMEESGNESSDDLLSSSGKNKRKKRRGLLSTSSEGECETASGPSVGAPPYSMSDWVGQTTNSEECSYSSQSDNSRSDVGWHRNNSTWDPFSILNPASDTVKCLMWEKGEMLKAELSAVDISWFVVARAERAMALDGGYLWAGVAMATIVALLGPLLRLLQAAVTAADNARVGDESGYGLVQLATCLLSHSGGSALGVLAVAWGDNAWLVTMNATSCFLRLSLSGLAFFLLSVAERAYKQRLLYAKLFSHLTSARRASMSELPHFRLHTVRNIKTWLSARSYLRRRGPQRSVDVIVSSAFVVTVTLLACVSAQLLRESESMESAWVLQVLAWCACLGAYLLRLLTLGSAINRKYRGCLSAIITEQINLHLAVEQRPGSKERLAVANNVLKLAADLLKELDAPFKISGMCANHYLYTITKVVILSALSGVLSEMLGFKLKLHKIKIK